LCFTILWSFEFDLGTFFLGGGCVVLYKYMIVISASFLFFVYVSISSYVSNEEGSQPLPWNHLTSSDTITNNIIDVVDIYTHPINSYLQLTRTMQRSKKIYNMKIHRGNNSGQEKHRSFVTVCWMTDTMFQTIKYWHIFTSIT
jgi:hypothetical protein